MQGSLCDFLIFIEIMEIEAALQLEVVGNLGVTSNYLNNIPTNMRYPRNPGLVPTSSGSFGPFMNIYEYVIFYDRGPIREKKSADVRFRDCSAWSLLGPRHHPWSIGRRGFGPLRWARWTRPQRTASIGIWLEFDWNKMKNIGRIIWYNTI